MAIELTKISSTISALIEKEVLATLDRFRSKIFKIAEIQEDEYDIDTNKFAQNTAKKITESEEFTKIVSAISAAAKDAKENAKDAKEKKDPDAPKGAKNAFIFFCNDKREEIKKENPEMKSNEITKKLGEMWKDVDEDDKNSYQQMAKDDKERYAKEMENYEPKEGFKNPKEKKSKKVKSTAPKRAKNAYIFFCQENRQKVMEEKKLNNSEIMTVMGEMWKKMTDKKKKPYVDMAEKDKARYVEEMKNYVPTEEEKQAKKSKKSSKKVSNGPKRPLSAYLLFCKEKREQVKTDHPEMKSKDIMKKLGEMWSELKEKEKKKYTEKAEKLKAEFESEKKKVEEVEEEEEDEAEEEESILEDDEEDEEEEEEEIPVKNTKTNNSKKSKK
jgi:upstream-binding transcription factor